MSFRSPRLIAPLAAVTLTAGFALVFFFAPNDADQGLIQKIFYLHVPLATCALVGFMIAGIQAILHLRTRNPKWDVRSYVSIHISVIFGVAVLLTGAIWARAAWGKWFVWEEPTLVSFLIVFLLYCTYYPLRYSIEDRERQARYASVFAITAGAFVPLNFLAVRLAESLVHPRVFATSDGGLPPKMRVTFLVCLAGMALLWEALVRFELAAKSTRARDRPPAPGARGQRRAAGLVADRAGAARGSGGRLMPALPLDEAGKYIAGAYVVFLALLLIYVSIMATRLAAHRPRARRARGTRGARSPRASRRARREEVLAMS